MVSNCNRNEIFKNYCSKWTECLIANSQALRPNQQIPKFKASSPSPYCGEVQMIMTHATQSNHVKGGIIDYQDEGFCVLGSSSFHLVRTSRCLQFDIRVFDDANRASKCRMSKSLDTRSYLELKNNNSTVSSCPSPGSGSKT